MSSADLLAGAGYLQLRNRRPDWFANEPSGYEILFDDASIQEAQRTQLQRFQLAAAEAQLQQPLPEWVRVGLIWEDPYMLLLRDAVRDPDGQLRTYDRIMPRPDTGPGAAILAEWQGRYLLVRHHRHALRSFLWEAPRGFSRPTESAEDTARRELQEETGCVAGELLSLGIVHPDGGKLADAAELFFTTVLSIEACHSRGAISQTRFVDVESLASMVASGAITDGFTLSLYARASARALL